MDEERIKQIAQQVYDSNTKRDQLSTLKVPRHVHNGIDSPLIPTDKIGTSLSGYSVIDENNISTPTSVQLFTGGPTVFTVPIVYHGVSGGFNGGSAPSGTIIVSDSGTYSTSILWVKTDNGWYGVPFTLIA